MAEVVVVPCMPQITMPFLAAMIAARASARRVIGRLSRFASSNAGFPARMADE